VYPRAGIKARPASQTRNLGLYQWGGCIATMREAGILRLAFDQHLLEFIGVIVWSLFRFDKIEKGAPDS
jgi:hypothetical protein